MPLDVALGPLEVTVFHGNGCGARTGPSLPRLELLGAILARRILQGLAWNAIRQWVFLEVADAETRFLIPFGRCAWFRINRSNLNVTGGGTETDCEGSVHEQ